MLKAQNTFKQDTDVKNPGLWQHSIDRPDTGTFIQTLGVFAIILLFMLAAVLIFYAASEYPKAYPAEKETVK